MFSLKEYFLFSNEDFKRFFNFDYESLINMTKEDLNYQECLEKSVMFIDPFVDHNSDHRLKHLIEVLHVIYSLSYETISCFSGIKQEEILNYLKDSRTITEAQKFVCCSRLTLLDRIISNMVPPKYILEDE
ncbi:MULTISPECIES: HTH domain-containing protein [Listeria]|uniref:HTH domain-containing protein n=1 Tax=Listeria TaxID=1637 RepID=UPI002892E85D|nr:MULTISPECIES: HTH domain-containing protein [Listeria]